MTQSEVQDIYRSKALPLKVGIIMDVPPRYGDPALRVYEMVREAYRASGRLTRDVEFVVETSFGPPAGYIQNSVDAYNKLCDQGCLLVVGPTHSDTNIAIPPHVEARKVPVVAIGATAQHMNEHVFSVPWSSIPQDAFLVASWLRKNGYKRIVLTWDHATHSLEYTVHFRVACARAGIKILNDVRFRETMDADLETVFAATVADFKRLEPDALAHFGTSETAAFWAKHVTESDWGIPRIMNDAFFGAALPEYTAWHEGWVGTTLWDDANPTMAAFAKAYVERYPEDVPPYELLAIYRDAMTVAMEGLVLATIATPKGAKEGLEKIQFLATCAGGPRTCIAFGPHDRRGYKGADISVLRRVKDNKLVMEGYMEMF